MTAAENPADAEAVAMIRALLADFTAHPARYTRWDATFIAEMYLLTTAWTDGTPVFDGRRYVWICDLHEGIKP